MRLRMHRARWVLLLALLAVPAAVGCAISAKNGLWTITPVGGPPDMAPTGEFTDPDTGKTYELWDTDGDGSADYVRGEDGRTFRVEPMLPKSLVGGGGPHLGTPAPAGARDWWNLYQNPPDQLMPVTFTKTAAEYLDEYGLDAVMPGQSAVLTSGLTVHDFDPVTLEADLTLAWSASLSLPDILEFPSLQYEFYELSDSPQDFGQFLSLRVVGPFQAAAGWLAAIGFQEIQCDTDAGHVEMILDPWNDSLLVLLAGQVIYDGPLG